MTFARGLQVGNWWEIGVPDPDSPALVRAVAYYRHSAQDRQENSIPIQQDQVRAWALEHGVEIIREFCDAGRSGLTSEGRPAFMEMMEEWLSVFSPLCSVSTMGVWEWRIARALRESAICGGGASTSIEPSGSGGQSQSSGHHAAAEVRLRMFRHRCLSLQADRDAAVSVVMDCRAGRAVEQSDERDADAIDRSREMVTMQSMSGLNQKLAEVLVASASSHETRCCRRFHRRL